MTSRHRTLKVDASLLAGSIDEIARTAAAAESVGFDGIQTAEAAHDPFLPLLAAAEHSKRLDLATSIAVAFPRSPMITAYTAWDLQRYSKGRFILGLGTQVRGHNIRRFSIPWDKPGPRLREVILSLRAIWDCWQNGTPLDFEGEYYRFSLMTPFFNPGPQSDPHVPIYIAGVNRYICKLAGELCDGFFVHPLHSVRYVDEIVKPLIAAGAERAGRNAEDCKLSASCFVVAGGNPQELANAAEAIKQQIAFYASTPAYAPVFAAHGWEQTATELTELSRQGRWGDMGTLISDEMLAEFAVVGRREDIAARLREKYHGRVDRVSPYLPFSADTDPDWWRDLTRTLHA